MLRRPPWESRVRDSSYRTRRMATAWARPLKAAEPDAGAQEFLRIDCFAVDPCLVVQVRAGGASGRADLTDSVADAYLLPYLYADVREVAVAGGKAVAVVEFDHVAIPSLGAGDGYLAVGGGTNRIARVAAQVDAGMNGWAPEERIHAHAERRAHVDFADDRFAHRHGDERLGILVDLRARDVDAVKLALEGTRA